MRRSIAKPIGANVNAFETSQTNRGSCPVVAQHAWSIFALIAVCLFGQSANATTYTWTGATSTSWSTASNWVNGAVPVAGSAVLFNSGTYSNSPVLTTTSSAGALWDTGSGPITISGSTVTLQLSGTNVNGNSNIGIEMDGAAGNLSISSLLSLTGSQTWLNNSGSSLLSVSGNITNNSNNLAIAGSGNTVISGALSGSGGLIQIGNALLTLSGTNTYSGGTTISGGTLRTASASALGSTIANLTVNGGVLDLDGVSRSLGSLLGSGGTILSNSGAVTLTVNGPSLSSATTYGGILANGLGTLSLSRAGSGTLTLTGNNTYTGNTTITSGTLTIGGNGVLGLSGNYGGNISIGSGGRLTYNTMANQILSGVISGNGTSGLGQLGPGQLTLVGTSTYSCPTTVSGGTLYAGASSALSASSAMTVTGGVLDVSSFATTVGQLTIGSSGQLNLNIGNLLTSNSSATLAGTLNLSGVPTGTNIELLAYPTYTGSFSTALGVPSGYHLSYASNQLDLLYFGLITWNSTASGSWNAGGNWDVGVVPNGIQQPVLLGTLPTTPTTITLDGPQIVGSLTFNNTAGYTVTPGSAGTLTFDNTGGTGSAQLLVLAGTHAITAPVTIGNSSLIFSSSNGGSMTISGNIKDNGTGQSLIITGDGTGSLTLAGSNSFGGSMAFNSGTLLLANSAAVPTSSALIVSVNNGLAFAPGIGTFRMGALSGSGNIVLSDSNSAPVTLQIGSKVAPTLYSGILSGPGGLTNTGGTLTLTNANTFSGNTTISGGVIALYNSSALSASTVKVGNNYSLEFASSGSINTFYLGGLSGSGNVTLTDATNTPVNLQFGADGANTTYSGVLAGASHLTKVGSGTTTLSNNNGYTGATTVAAGQLVLQGNSLSTSFTAQSGGTLQVATSLNLGANAITAQSGGEITYNNATIAGGYLRGPGTHVTLPGSSNTLNGVTTYNSTAIQQNGTDNFNNFTNGGSITNNATLDWNGGANNGTGSLVVNGVVNVQDWGNQGVVTVNSGGTLNNAVSDAVSYGGARITVNAGGQINANSDSSGSALDLNGSLLVNNGIVTGTTNVNYGSLAQGTGVYGPVNVNSGGVFKPGNSPGAVQTGSATWNSGAEYLVEFNNANGTAGTNWNLWNIDGALALSAGTPSGSPFVVALESLSGSGPGTALNFDPTVANQWLIADTTAGISSFNPADIVVDASQFSNNLDGGQFSVAQAGNNVELVFTPVNAVPEPGTLALLVAAAVGLVGYRFRRRTIAKLGCKLAAAMLVCNCFTTIAHANMIFDIREDANLNSGFIPSAANQYGHNITLLGGVSSYVMDLYGLVIDGSCQSSVVNGVSVSVPVGASGPNVNDTLSVVGAIGYQFTSSTNGATAGQFSINLPYLSVVPSQSAGSAFNTANSASGWGLSTLSQAAPSSQDIAIYPGALPFGPGYAYGSGTSAATSGNFSEFLLGTFLTSFNTITTGSTNLAVNLSTRATSKVYAWSESGGSSQQSTVSAAGAANPTAGLTPSMNSSFGSVGIFGGAADNGWMYESVTFAPPAGTNAYIALSNALSASIITGGTTTLGATVQNGALAGSNNLNYSVSASVLSGSASLGTITSSTGSLLPSASQACTVSATSTNIGANTVLFSANDPNASNSPQSIAATLNVLDHASGSLGISTLRFGPVHVGYSGGLSTMSGATISNAPGMRVNLMTSGGNASAGGITLSGDLHGLTPGGPAGTISATLAGGLPIGPISQSFPLTFGDDSGLSGASSNVGGTTLSVIGQVYSGLSTWAGSDGGSWGTPGGNFGMNWAANNGSPGLDPNFKAIDTATFGGSVLSGMVAITLDGANPSLAAITFSNTAASYVITSGSGGSLSLSASGAGGAPITVTGHHAIAAPMALNSTALVTTPNAPDSLSISGNLSGTGGLTKTGNGMLNVSGSNSYSGPTSVNQGEFEVNGSLASLVTVNSGGMLAGTGRLTSVTVNPGGIFSPGDAPGPISLSGNLSLLLGAMMDYQLDNPFDSDQVLMSSGTLSLDEQQISDFNFEPLGGFGPGVYQLIDAVSVTGVLGPDTTDTIDGQPVSLAVFNNELVLNVAPEPGTLTLLGICFVGMGCCYRRRRSSA